MRVTQVRQLAAILLRRRQAEEIAKLRASRVVHKH